MTLVEMGCDELMLGRVPHYLAGCPRGCAAHFYHIPMLPLTSPLQNCSCPKNIGVILGQCCFFCYLQMRHRAAQHVCTGLPAPRIAMPCSLSLLRPCTKSSNSLWIGSLFTTS